MSGGLSVEQHIDAVDAFARTLFVRARDSPSISDAVRQLHTALRHLRVEASDPDSLLGSGTWDQQINALVDDCGAALRQLEGALDDGRRGDQLAGRVRRLRDRVDDFLDGVQLQSRTAIAPVKCDPSGLETIKDKVDTVAERVFSRRQSSFGNDEDQLWREFKSELEKEGFSSEVLKKNKVVLRAYIRELDAMSSQSGGPRPTVRGLLEYETEAAPPKEKYPAVENEKFPTGMKHARRMPADEPPPPLPPKEPIAELQSSQPRTSTSSDDSHHADSADSTALISTKDLVAMDSLNSGLAGMHLSTQPQTASSYGASPANNTQRYLPAPYAGTIGAPRSQDLAELPGSPSSAVFGSSPHAPPNYGTSPRSAPTFRLAPDSYGKEIPMDAQWTRINRGRVSPEVLERAGVRYEARPSYVAVLGRLTREQIEDFARQSADVRRARELRQPSPPRKYRDRQDSKSSRDEEDEDSDLWDSSDSTDIDDDKTSIRGTRSYPYIVHPPEKEKGSPSATVQPKSILKNKNEHHVRFGPDPYEVESKSPRSLKDVRDRDRDRERRRRHSDDRYHGDRDREYSGRRSQRSRRDDPRRRDDHRHRDHRDDRDEYRDRHSKKKAWGEALGAVGIGGAAVSLLSVLAEAASNV